VLGGALRYAKQEYPLKSGAAPRRSVYAWRVMIVSARAPEGGQTAATDRLITSPETVPDKRRLVGAGPAQLTAVPRAAPSK